MISIRKTKEEKPKARKKNWLGPTDNTVRDRIITELTSYNISVNMDSTLEKTQKEIARQIYGMERINRMNIPLIALVLVLRRENNDELYQEHIDVYIRKMLSLKDVPKEEVMRDGLQIDIIRYNRVIDQFIAESQGISYEDIEDEEEFYEDEPPAEQIDDE